MKRQLPLSYISTYDWNDPLELKPTVQHHYKYSGNGINISFVTHIMDNKMGIFRPLLNRTDQSQKHPKDIKRLLEINPTPITPASMYLFLSLSVSLHNSSRVPHFWEKPLRANFTCLVITFCYWRRDIKHSGVFSWEQPRCDPWNKLNIRRKEAACQRWEWQGAIQRGVSSTALCFLAGEWRVAEEMLSRLQEHHKSTEKNGSSCFSLENESRP